VKSSPHQIRVPPAVPSRFHITVLPDMTTDCCTSAYRSLILPSTKMPSSQSADAALLLCTKDSSKVLGLTVGSHNVSPGAFIPKAGQSHILQPSIFNHWQIIDHSPEAQSPPELSFNVPSPSASYILISIDLDGPFPSFAVLSPILHWIQPCLKAITREDGSAVLQATGSVIANYIGPSPPSGSGPHRYIFCLYEQPEGFEAANYAPPNGKEYGMWSRIRFDLDAWEKGLGLGSAIASNYFLSN
jgi:phosphatidylethanolamine-binding protein